MVSQKKWDRKGQQLSRQQKSVHLVMLFPNTTERRNPRIPLCNLERMAAVRNFCWLGTTLFASASKGEAAMPILQGVELTIVVKELMYMTVTIAERIFWRGCG